MVIEKTELPNKAMEIRQAVVDMCCRAGMGHIAPAFSCTELLVALYYGNILKYNPRDPKWEERDYFILSKGQACAALYAILADVGFFDKELLKGYCQNGSPLGGHAELNVPGVEAYTGSLGMGLSQACGLAKGLKIQNKDNKVFCLIGDGESQEGAIWEAIIYAAANKLDNLVVILDNNHMQATEKIRNVVGNFYPSEMFHVARWNLFTVDGHNFDDILAAMRLGMWCNNIPTAIIAKTIKGCGVIEIENKAMWHYRIPTTDEEKRWFIEAGFCLPEEDPHDKLLTKMMPDIVGLVLGEDRENNGNHLDNVLQRSDIISLLKSMGSE